MSNATQLGMLGEPDRERCRMAVTERFEEWGGGYAAPPGTGPEGCRCEECGNRHEHRGPVQDVGHLCVSSTTGKPLPPGSLMTQAIYHKCALVREQWDGTARTDIDPRSPGCELYLETGEWM